MDKIKASLKGVSWLLVIGLLGGLLYFTFVAPDLTMFGHLLALLGATLLPSVVDAKTLEPIIQLILATLTKKPPGPSA